MSIPNADQHVPGIPTGYTCYTRPLDPRLSHISIDTCHTRNASQSTNASLPMSSKPRISDGPLSLTADRYHGANNFSTPQTQPSPLHRRRPNGLSIDTMRSQESYRNSCGHQWQSPLLRRNNLTASKVGADSVPFGNRDL